MRKRLGEAELVFLVARHHVRALAALFDGTIAEDFVEVALHEQVFPHALSVTAGRGGALEVFAALDHIPAHFGVGHVAESIVRVRGVFVHRVHRRDCALDAKDPGHVFAVRVELAKGSTGGLHLGKVAALGVLRALHIARGLHLDLGDQKAKIARVRAAPEHKGLWDVAVEGHLVIGCAKARGLEHLGLNREVVAPLLEKTLARVQVVVVLDWGLRIVKGKDELLKIVAFGTLDRNGAGDLARLGRLLVLRHCGRIAGLVLGVVVSLFFRFLFLHNGRRAAPAERHNRGGVLELRARETRRPEVRAATLRRRPGFSSDSVPVHFRLGDIGGTAAGIDAAHAAGAHEVELARTNVEEIDICPPRIGRCRAL